MPTRLILPKRIFPMYKLRLSLLLLEALIVLWYFLTRNKINTIFSPGRHCSVFTPTAPPVPWALPRSLPGLPRSSQPSVLRQGAPGPPRTWTGLCRMLTPRCFTCWPFSFSSPERPEHWPAAARPSSRNAFLSSASALHNWHLQALWGSLLCFQLCVKGLEARCNHTAGGQQCLSLNIPNSPSPEAGAGRRAPGHSNAQAKGTRLHCWPARHEGVCNLPCQLLIPMVFEVCFQDRPTRGRAKQSACPRARRVHEQRGNVWCALPPDTPSLNVPTDTHS